VIGGMSYSCMNNSKMLVLRFGLLVRQLDWSVLLIESLTGVLVSDDATLFWRSFGGNFGVRRPSNDCGRRRKRIGHGVF